MTASIAYAVSRFPLVTETFVLREMMELRRRGWPVDLYSIVHETGRVVHPEARPYEARAHFLSDMRGELVRANLNLVRRDPATYGRLLLQTAVGNRHSPGFLARGLAIYPGAVAFAARMQRRGIQHVHAHFGTHATLLAMLAAEINGIGFSFTAHAVDLYVDTTMLAEKVRRAKFVATISEFNRRLLVDLAGPETGSKIHVVRCGVDLDDYEYTSHARCEGPLRILAVGSLRDYKGHEHLIRACALLRASAPALQFTCQIVGEGPLRRRLEQFIERMDLADVVTLEGARDQHQVLEAMRQADLLVLPSVVAQNGLMEGIPVVLMEALAVGLPVIASDISGIPEIVRDDDTGLLVPPDDACAIRDAVLRVVHDPTAAQARAVRGRALVEHEYGLVNNVGRLERLLQSATASPLAMAS